MERRGAKRIEYSCEVEIEGPLPDPIRPRMRDLSATGAFIEPGTRAKEGVRLLLRFVLPSGEVSLNAELARVTESGMGVRVLDVCEAQQALIAAAIAEVAAGR
jgi:hypothetical protein